MSEPVLVALQVLAVGIALGSAPLLLAADRSLPRTAPAATIARPVSVVIPARDEELTLPALLDSLAALRTPVDEVIVVDDGSRDATAELARAGSATVLRATDPPPGWTGKAWACHSGTQAASGTTLLFLDADTRLAPDALERLAAAHSAGAGLVSVQPFHTVVRPYEQLSSYFNIVAILASGAFLPAGLSRPVAFGPCLLTSRVDYEAAGGHVGVRRAILDDLELARAYRRAGREVHCYRGAQTVWMHSYPAGVRAMVASWTKSLAAGAGAVSRVAMLLSVAWLCAHHAVLVGALVAAGRAVSGGGGYAVWGWLAAWLAVAVQLRWLLRRAGSFRWWTWVLFPVPLLVFDLVFALSLVQTAVRRSVRWRGREVRLRREDGAGGGAACRS